MTGVHNNHFAPSVNECDGVVDILDRDEKEYRSKNFPESTVSRGQQIRRIRDPLAHQGVIATHIPHKGRGHVLPRHVYLAIKHDLTVSVLDQVLDTLSMCLPDDSG